jgi:nucleoid-associated protein YgaU
MGQCPVKEVVTLDEKAPDMLQIYRVTGRPYVDFVETVDGKVNINGAVDVNILYVTGNDELPVYCCHGVVPFSHTAQATGAQAGMECSVDARLEHIGFNMLSGREVEIRCVVNIVTSVERECRYTLVGDVELKPLDKEYLNSLSSITLYVVRKGDTLWKIAKHFNTTVEDIVKVNDIDNPDLIYPGERLIVVKRTA